MPSSTEVQDQPAQWEPSSHDVDTKAWKYTGYRSFCKFVSSDEDFFILRRFGALSARVLLDLQDQLTCLEADLEALEQHHRQKDVPDIHNGSFRRETQPERKRLVSEAQRLLREYNDLVLQHSQLRMRPEVHRKGILNLEHWFHNHPNAIFAGETEYIKHSKDLFALVPAIKSPLRVLLERSRHFRLLKVWQQKPSDSTLAKNENVHYISDAKIDRFVTIFIMSLGLTMLIAPLWILAYLGGLAQRLGVISAFVALFVTLISLTTVAKPFESLAAAAAYSAVLMVFLQISGNN